MSGSLVVDGKRCSTCRVVRPTSDFYVSRRATGGLASRCKPCANRATVESRARHRERQRAADRAWYARNRHKARAYNVQKLYGLTPCQHDALLAAQGFLCALCGRLPMGRANGSRLHVDHDHETGAVRGLLCRDCNHALGKFKDDAEVLRRAADYLEGSRQCQAL